MANVIQAFLNDMGFVSGDVLTINNVCALFILILVLTFISELCGALIGVWKK